MSNTKLGVWYFDFGNGPEQAWNVIGYDDGDVCHDRPWTVRREWLDAIYQLTTPDNADYTIRLPDFNVCLFKLKDEYRLSIEGFGLPHMSWCVTEAALAELHAMLAPPHLDALRAEAEAEDRQAEVDMAAEEIESRRIEDEQAEEMTDEEARP